MEPVSTNPTSPRTPERSPIWIVKRAKKIGEDRSKRHKIVNRKRFLHQRQEKHVQEVRPSEVRKKAGKNWHRAALPATLCLIKNRNESLKFFSQIQAAFDHPMTAGIEVDHTTIVDIGIEAALLLVAEFTRMKRYAPEVKLRGRLSGMPENVRQVLDGIGYFSFYSGRIPNATGVSDTQT